MRILIGSISFYPNLSGVAVSSHLLAKHLAKQGHEVIVVTSNFGLRTTVERNKQTGLTIYRIPSYPNPVRKGFYLPFFPADVVDAIVEEVRPDVIHLQDPLLMCRKIRASAAARHIPVVVTNHFMLDYLVSYFPWPIKPFVHHVIGQKIIDFYNLCNAVTCPTETVAATLRARGVTQPLYALSNGVDIHRFYSFSSLQPLRAQYHLPHSPLILYVGRIDREKSLGTLIRALPEILSRTKAHLVLAGTGTALKTVQRAVKKYGMEAHVTFTGSIPHNDERLVSLYQAASVFVMPSALETQSIVTMEAMAAGKPIVAANSGALPELVQHGGNGLLFQPGNSHDLASKVATLLKDPALSAQMSEKSLELVARHELNGSLNLYEQVYKSVYNSAGVPRLDPADSRL